MRQVQVVGYRTVRMARQVVPMMKANQLSDIDAIKAVAAGNTEAYKAIVERYMRRAYNIAITYVRNPEDALDVSQAAFVRAYRNLKRFDATRPFFPWFYRILRNICLDHLKRASRCREIPLEDVEIIGTPARDHELRRILWLAIEELPPIQREVIVLRYFQGLSYKEMAETLDRPLGTIMSSLYYARQRLRTVIGGIRDEVKE